MAGNAPTSTTSGSRSIATRTTQQQLQARIEQLEQLVVQQSTASAGSLRIRKVELFLGEAGILDRFLTQLRIYYSNNSTRILKETDKVLAASSFLTGDAMKWFSPYMENWLGDGTDQAELETVSLFTSFNYFKNKLKQLYGTINEELVAIYKIQNVQQVRSIGEYISKYLQVSNNLKYSDQGHRDQFYQGLKESVKDMIAMMQPRPEIFHNMMAATSQIDLQQYNRQLKKKGANWGGYQSNILRPKRPQYDKDGDVRMYLNAIVTKEEKKRRRKERACYKCGKKGHFANQCQQRSNNRMANRSSINKIATIIEKNPRQPKSSKDA
jgi:hypothetical protein